jgi:hypothetical protein
MYRRYLGTFHIELRDIITTVSMTQLVSKWLQSFLLH